MVILKFCFLTTVVTLVLMRYLKASKAGSSKVRIVQLKDCQLPADDFDHAASISHYMSAYKLDRDRTRIRANFTVEKKTGPILTTVKYYEVLRGSQLNKVSENKDMTCANPMVTTFNLLIGVNATNDCYLLPGVYSFDNFDVNHLKHFMIFAWKSGRYAYDCEFRTPLGLVACIRVVLDYYKN